MKKGCLTLWLIVAITSFVMGQKRNPPKLPISKETQLITYTDVVYVDSTLSADKLYLKAREWFAKSYNTSTDVIQLDDRENGLIVGKGLIQVYKRGGFGLDFPYGFINYTLSIYLRDGRFMYEITNFYHMGLGQFLEEIPVPDFGPCEEMLNPSKRMTRRFERRSFDYILIQMDVYINNLITDLTKAMKSESVILRQDW
ncbi:DUF4468 domain-containing protein [Penaeicola halotolerans]|uniref:DUF4468 domain-containing protein n=1 Tax=Penaeicola halotolerans TaxID=2793196 RepID=UPI001CF819FA|nr:DUF4468 domain-containing protein [Penaeicola halotolerans]